jgi:hypothetical protein
MREWGEGIVLVVAIRDVYKEVMGSASETGTWLTIVLLRGIHWHLAWYK